MIPPLSHVFRLVLADLIAAVYSSPINTIEIRNQLNHSYSLSVILVQKMFPRSYKGSSQPEEIPYRDSNKIALQDWLWRHNLCAETKVRVCYSLSVKQLIAVCQAESLNCSSARFLDNVVHSWWEYKLQHPGASQLPTPSLLSVTVDWMWVTGVIRTNTQ